MLLPMFSGCSNSAPSQTDIAGAMERFARTMSERVGIDHNTDGTVNSDVKLKGCVQQAGTWQCEVEFMEVWRNSPKRKPFVGKVTLVEQTDGWTVVDVERAKR